MGKITIKNCFGFTFVEILVSITVLGIVLPILFSIIFTIFRQQTKIYRLNEVKKQGDYILVLSKNLVRNYASGIYSESNFTNQKCDGILNTNYTSATSGKDFYFRDKNGSPFNIFLDSGQVATGSGGINSIKITNNQVVVENFTLACENTSSAADSFVTIKFDIRYNTTSTRKEDSASLSYQSSFKLRN